MATATNLELRRGDSRNIRARITFEQAPMNPVDITGSVVRFTVARTAGQVLFSLATYDPSEVFISDGPGGEVLIQISSGKTHGAAAGEYCWDLELNRPDGVVSTAGTASVGSSSGVITFSDAAVVAAAEPGFLVDLTGASQPANQRLVAVTEVGPSDTLTASQLRTDYTDFTAEIGIAHQLIRGNVKTPDRLFGLLTLLPDVTL